MKRTAGDVFAGLAALVALVGLLGGVPYALIRFAGPPIPEELLDLDALMSQVGTETIIAVLVLLVWVAWLQLVVCVLVEVYAGIRRIGMPARVPLSGGTQVLANRLVSAVLVLFTVTAVAVPLARFASTPVMPVKPTLVSAESTIPERAALVPRGEVKKVYVVQPPHGRHHESLWEIAEKCLGDGRRYGEIYELNKHKEQPDGARLHMADLIRPGWVLDMPGDARNTHVVPADDSRPEILKDHPGPPSTDNSERTAPNPDRSTQPDRASQPDRTTQPDRATQPDRTTQPDRDTTRPGDDTRFENRDNTHAQPPGERPTADPTRPPAENRQPTANPTPPPAAGEGDATRPPAATEPTRPPVDGDLTLPGDASRPGLDNSTRPPATANPENTRPPATGEQTRPPAETDRNRPTADPTRPGQTETGKPGTGTPETGKPGTGTPETGKPDSARPETGSQESARPETGSQESARPETGTHESARPETGKPEATADPERTQPRKPIPTVTATTPAEEAGIGDTTIPRSGVIAAPDGGTILTTPAAAQGWTEQVDLADFLAGAGLLSAGLLLLLGRRRRQQLWTRAFGHRIQRPRGEAASAEVAMRLGADAPGSRILDSGLRLLGRLLAEADRRPPAIYALHLSARGMDLWVHPPSQDAPAPFEAADGGQIWRLAAHEARRLDDLALADVPAPYPGLFSLGTAETGRVLVDLEAAHGVISVVGPQAVAALSALAVELVTNRWSDTMRVTLVGFGQELRAIAPDRVAVAASLAEVLPQFENAAQPPDVLTGRIHGRAHDPVHPPHYLLSAVQPSADEARRLAVLAKNTRSAAGYVIAAPLQHATWTWEVTEDGRSVIDALGFDVKAQLLPRRHYQAIVDLFRTADDKRGEPLPLPDIRRHDEPPAIEVRILGPIEISPVNALEEGRAALANELVVYLATHPGGVHPVVLGGVLWPRGVQPMVRDATLARVAEWLGADHRGRPYLYADPSGRLHLSDEVRTDWSMFQDLVRRGDPMSLEKALHLVRGPLLNSRPAGRYAWLAADPLEFDITASVADAAHRLCESRLYRGDAEAAIAAARAGLLLAADDEGLWRDLLRAAHATGEPARLRAVVDGLHRRAASHPYGGGMAPETEALIDELLPVWRATTTA
ncbi:hypothetical protein [Herbidospora daliensis]|uniref:hypothetical protein n=1 Tax=Herbidospora daliensis TaxID=295585 RepID=UPI0007801C15|nr:hypothetical protein [Herbidospora daliensis]